MYPRNSAAPERIAVGAVILIADGTVQTATVLITVVAQGGVSAAGLGTTSYEQGIVFYLPTQAETNFTSFIVTAYKASCIPVSVTVVTTGSATAGRVLLSGETHTSAVIPTVTTVGTLTTYTGNTPQTGDNFARLGAPAGASVSADVAAVKVDTAAVKVKTDFLPSVAAGGVGGVFIAGTNAATTITTGLTTTFTGSLTGSVGSVTGAVGSVTGAVGSVTANVNAALINGAHGGAAATASFGGAGGITSTLTGSVTGSVASVTGAVGSVTAGVTVTTNNDKTGYALTQTFPTNFAARVISAGGTAAADVTAVAGATATATKLNRVLIGNVTGTVGAGSTTTSIVTSALDPAASVADQYLGRIVNFGDNTTTAALRGQSTNITASTSLGVLTVVALTTAAVSGDTFVVS